MKNTCIIFFILVIFFVSGQLYADIIILRDGTRLEGEIIAETEKGISVKVQYGEIFITRDRLPAATSFRTPRPKTSSGKRQVKTVQFARDVHTGEPFAETFQDVRYMLYLPYEYDRGVACPLIIGFDPQGKGRGYMDFWQPAAEHHGYAVVCPMNEGRYWQPSEDKKIIALLQHLLEKHEHLDRRRVYVTGFSGGGCFTFCVGINNPRYFAAIAPVCAALINVDDDIRYSKKNQVPILMVHGSADEAVPPIYGRLARKKLKQYGYPVTYKEISGMGHECRQEDNELLVTFFKKHKRWSYKS